MSCPAFEDLIDFFEGRLRDDAAERVREHLGSGCRKCVHERGWYDRLRSVARKDSRFAPPAEAERRAILLFEREQPIRASGYSILPVVAHLSFDSMRDRASTGSRSTEAAERELVFTARDFSIDMQIAPGAVSGAEVAGQILRAGESGFASVSSVLVDLTTKDESVWSTTTNDVGEFMMIGVDFGEYELVVSTAEQEIRIPSLPIWL
ncbi:MAG TPA: hypothetical protein VJX67_08360 [Blastocatellia bacterium]|nr:hypothetical protein [Blastocatellia bacterium]